MQRRTKLAIWFLAAAVAGDLLAQTAAAGEEVAGRLRWPPVDVGADTLKARAAAQLRTVGDFGVTTAFRLVDRQPESGLDFVHHPVAEGGVGYMMVHYDHGTAVAAADVDGDGLTDLYFVDQAGGNALYRNLGGGRFADVTGEAGVAMDDRVSTAASFADVDGDGDPDLYVTSVRGGNRLFSNEGGWRFRDVTAASGLGVVGHCSGAVFFDFDRDGLLDLFVTRVGVYTTGERRADGSYPGRPDAFRGHLHPERAESNHLFRNLGDGRFADVTAEMGLADTTWSGDAAFADVDRDGWPDLYVLNMQGDDRFYRNDGGRRFVDATAATFPKSPWGAMGVAFFDWNLDGRLDLLLTDMHSDMSADVGPDQEKRKAVVTWRDEDLLGGADNLFGNAFWEAQADGSYRERSDEVGAENYWPWGVSIGDLNADGWEDVFIAASMNYPYRYGTNSLLLNDRGTTFRDAEFIVGVEPRRGGRTHRPWFTLDCSGADAARSECADREGRWIVEGTLGTRSSVIFDLEGDGDLDVVTLEFHDVPQVLVNDLAQRGATRFLAIELTGTRSNRDGLGALVAVHLADRVLTRQHDGKSGYLAQSSLPLWFGLGDGERVERVEVLWPSGHRQVVTEGLAVGGRIEIVEEAAEAGGKETAEPGGGR